MSTNCWEEEEQESHIEGIDDLFSLQFNCCKETLPLFLLLSLLFLQSHRLHSFSLFLYPINPPSSLIFSFFLSNPHRLYKPKKKKKSPPSLSLFFSFFLFPPIPPTHFSLFLPPIDPLPSIPKSQISLSLIPPTLAASLHPLLPPSLHRTIFFFTRIMGQPGRAGLTDNGYGSAVYDPFIKRVGYSLGPYLLSPVHDPTRLTALTLP